MSVKTRLLALAATAAAALSVVAGPTAAHADQFTAKHRVTPTLSNVHIVDNDTIGDDIMDFSRVSLPAKEISLSQSAQWVFGWCDDEVSVVGSIAASLDPSGNPHASGSLRMQEGNADCRNLGLAHYDVHSLSIIPNTVTFGKFSVNDGAGDSAKFSVALRDQVLSN